jgi:ABC-2 type transport system ATP-binding protein
MLTTEIEEENKQLSVNNLVKIYPKSNNRRALDTLTFSIPTKGIFVLIGRNGSGKTTLVRILSTELELTSGSATINGMDVMRDADLIRQKIAIVPQDSRAVPWMTPLQTVYSYLLWRGFDYSYAKKRALETLDRLGLGDSAKRLNRTLSGGNRRKVLVATVLASEAEIIFLDEPTTGLDPISRREFWDFLRSIGKERFTFLTTHYLEEAEELANEIGVLDRGKLVGLGTLDQLRSSVNYNYSLKIPLSPPLPSGLKVENGEIIEGKDGYRILTAEDEAFRISRELSKLNYRFAINPVSLDDIFFYLVNRQGVRDIGRGY